MRGPSSHWTSTTTNGVRSFHAGSTGGWTTTHESSVALPLASAHSLSVDRHFAHIGPGGCRQRLARGAALEAELAAPARRPVRHPVLAARAALEVGRSRVAHRVGRGIDPATDAIKRH